MDLGFEIIEHLATDGVTPKKGRFINSLEERAYEQ